MTSRGRMTKIGKAGGTGGSQEKGSDTKNKTWTQKTPGRLKPREGKHKDINRNSIENSIETCPMSCSVEPLR